MANVLGPSAYDDVSAALKAGPNGNFVFTEKVALKGSTVVLNGATPVTVANANITAKSVVIFTLKTVGGTVGEYPSIKTITPGTGFTVAGTAGDTSTYNFTVLETV